MDFSELLNLSELSSEFVVGTEGNVSQLVDNLVYIKETGKKLSNLKKEDFVCYDLDGVQKSNLDTKGSIETSFHILLYKKFKKKFICHTHPIETLKILCSKQIYEFSEKRYFPEQVVFNKEKSCVVEYSNPGEDLTKQIERDLDNFLDLNGFEPNLILLKNHGIITLGDSIDECIIPTQICEKSAKVYNSCYTNNQCDSLSKKQISLISCDQNQIIRQNKIKNLL